MDNKDTRSNAPSPPARREAGLGSLGAELTDLARTDPAALAQRVAQLTVREQAELALRLPAEQRMQLLLNSPKPMRLVRALPASEFYLTVREVGPTDALPLLALASGRQTRHLMDLESWRKDRFDSDRAGAWAALFIEAGGPTMRKLIRNTDDEALALLLSQWVRIEQIEYEDDPGQHGHGQGDEGTERGGLTPDGYHNFKPANPEHVPAVRKLLQILFVEYPDRYQRLLWDSQWELGSELEEQALYWRQSRLFDHGYPDMADAFAVYAPPLEPVKRPEAPATSDEDSLAASRAPLRLEAPGAGWIGAIDGLDDAMRERVLQELVCVANQLLVADSGDTGDTAAHRAALEKAAGYVGIALAERQTHQSTDPIQSLSNHPVLELFRQGWSHAQALQERARRLYGKRRAAGYDDPLEMLDSPVRERMAALLEFRPRHYAVDAESVGEVRDFRSRTELDEATVAIELAELFEPVIADLFGAEALATARAAASDNPLGPLFSTYILTAMAWNTVRDRLSLAPLPDDVVADFLRSVASRRTAPPEAPQRAFDAFMALVVEKAELDARQMSVLKAFGRYAVERLMSECAALDPGVPPSVREVSCLLLENRGADADLAR